MIAYHYPPILRSSGIHRTLKFAQYLPKFDWQPTILTINPRAYENCDPSFRNDLPNTEVHRVFGLDAARQLAYKGRYFKWTALPDRWISWWLGAIPAGLRLIRRQKPDFIWSTYPIASAHLIGLTLHKLTKIAWIADFRDPMTDAGYPTDPLIRSIYQWVERMTLQNCTCAVFTTEDTLAEYVKRFPTLAHHTWHVIPNGYDEQTFAEIEAQQATQPTPPKTAALTLVHAGTLYPSERDPGPFFAAIAALKNAQVISAETLKIVLRASGHETIYRQQTAQLGIEDIIHFEPSLPYQQAITEMLNADGLLLFQAANCNHQIPAKAYEYLRTKKPIFAMTPAQSNTAALLRSAAIDTIAPLDASDAIQTQLTIFLRALAEGTAPIASDAVIASHSRLARTEELAAILTKTLHSEH